MVKAGQRINFEETFELGNPKLPRGCHVKMKE